MEETQQASGTTPASGRLAGRNVVLVPLDEDCLVDGELHPGIRQRLLRIRELPSRSVATLLGVRRRDGQTLLAWEAVEGPTLETLLSDPCTSSSVLRNALAELRRAVLSLHQLGLVHGDLRADNVILARDRVVLTRLSPLLHHDPRTDLEALRLVEARAAEHRELSGESSINRDARGDPSAGRLNETSLGTSNDVVTARASSRETQRESSRETQRESSRETPRDCSRDMPRDTLRDLPRDMPRDTSKATPLDTSGNVVSSCDSPRDWLSIAAVLIIGGLLSLAAWWLTRSGA